MATIQQEVARHLTDDALAQRVLMFTANRRAFSRAEVDAMLTEAARRLRWGRKADVDAGGAVLTAGGVTK